MIAEGVAEGERAALLASAALEDVDVVRERSRRRSMKKRTEGTVGVRPVSVADGREARAVGGERAEYGHRHLDVDDRLGGQSRNRGRSVVIDPQRDRLQRMANATGFGLECGRPR